MKRPPIGSAEDAFRKINKAISLKSVSAKARLEGLVFQMTVCQRYRNETGANLEVVYTFPLAYGAELIGLKFRLNQKELIGVVVESKKAQESYEEAIDKGDTPIMLTKSSDGLFTVNLGNFLNGEEVEVEYRYAQLLRFENKQIRVAVPMTVAPRYGDLHAAGELKMHESVEPNLLASYPLDLAVEICGALAKAKVSCPNHRIKSKYLDDGLIITLVDARLDRDFVLSLEDLSGYSFSLNAPDPTTEGAYAVVASFCPSFEVKREPISLSLLVDCSASMGGSSIVEAKKALSDIVSKLLPGDYVSLSVFGTDYKHLTRRLVRIDDKSTAQLAQMVTNIEANLGGTELYSALESTIKDIKGPEKALAKRSVLLITDGEVAGVEDLKGLALQSQTRIFTVGVGFSPHESLLQILSESTSGAAQFVSPNEDIHEAVVRIFYRLQTSLAEKARVDWGTEVLWESKLPYGFYNGETLNLFALTKGKPPRPAVLHWEREGESFELSGTSLADCQFDFLHRLLGAARLKGEADYEKQVELGVKYQLVTNNTNYFLVHERQLDKAQSFPLLQQVPQMLAHQWGGVSATPCLQRLGAREVVGKRFSAIESKQLLRTASCLNFSAVDNSSVYDSLVYNSSVNNSSVNYAMLNDQIYALISNIPDNLFAKYGNFEAAFNSRQFQSWLLAEVYNVLEDLVTLFGCLERHQIMAIIIDFFCSEKNLVLGPNLTAKIAQELGVLDAIVIGKVQKGIGKNFSNCDII